MLQTVAVGSVLFYAMAVLGKCRSLWFGLLIDKKEISQSTNLHLFSMQVNRKGGMIINAIQLGGGL